MGGDMGLVILVMDADRPTLIVSSVLKKEGFDVCTAMTVEEGLDKARELNPALIILDLMGPNMGGYAMCQRLRADPGTRTIGVIILTTQGNVEADVHNSGQFLRCVRDRVKGFDSGAVEFLNKPIKAKELTQRVKAVLWAGGLPISL